MLDVREMIRRFKSGQKIRAIARDLKISRNTIRAYHKWADKEGLLVAGADLPTPGELEARLARSAPEVAESSVEPYRAFVTAKLEEGVELKALLGLLKEKEPEFKGSYSSLWRFAQKIVLRPPETFVRVETPPGEEAQVDFGYVGKFTDPAEQRERKGWVFLMTLSWSRHQYAEIVFDQKVETWIALHVRAFEFFGGVVEKVVIDNLKAGIVKAVRHEPEAQRCYEEFAGHYGFKIAPCRPKTPEHKGKVESGIHYIQRNALAGRTFKDVDQANAHLVRWIMTTAGTRDHGTTHEAPLARFNDRERGALKPLPLSRYEVTVWKRAKLHPDCHVVFEGSYYSAPHRLVGQHLWLRVMAERLEIYHQHERVATHPRAKGRGVRVTSNDHMLPEKAQSLLTTADYLCRQAAQIGPKTEEFITLFLNQRPMDRLRAAQGIVLGFAKRYGPERLEAACRRALAYDDIKYGTIKNILDRGLDREALENPDAQQGPLPKTSTYARPVHEQIPQKKLFRN